MVGQGETRRLAAFQGRWLAKTAARRVGLFASVSFDASIWEIVMPWAETAALVVIAKEARADIRGLIGALRRNRIDAITLPPRLLDDLDPATLPNLRLLVLAGEATTPQLAAGLSAILPYVNAYGPTESTVCATAYWVPASFSADEPTVPIGAPVWNTQIYIVDAGFEPCPIGVAGELWIGGVQVARGYLGRPGLTAEKFIADPFGSVAVARLYRSGDLARWRSDGVLEFLGRIDDQIKIRGMRVELGEIETALGAHPSVAQACVTARKSADGETRLIAYLVARGTQPGAEGEEAGSEVSGSGSPVAPRVVDLAGVIDLEELRARLRRRLPEHMVPSGFIGLSRLPLTASGKIDRKGLPEADIAVASTAYVAPRNATEALIAEVMRDVVSHDRLSLERVGLDDQFFDIGGHSIFAVQLAGRLERALGRAFPVRWVFETPTVRGLAQKLDETPAEARSLPEVVPADRSRPIPASFEQERMWLANQLFGDTPVYNEGLPLVLRGPMRTNALVGAVQGVLDRYESLRTRL